MLGGLSIIASIIGTFAVRSRSGNVERALYQGLVLSGGLAAVAFIPFTYWMMHHLTIGGRGGCTVVALLPVRADRARRSPDACS